ncbi:MAG: hypothetical protein ETSY2_47210 [Candidatus Entotheonella gemina]|uniref:Uncharacterized protein n=1 Tax=Candidatus Entotheonella gemina TaxID=1429439 RepID=W4LD62_9BACT|nr:MAG: hypothetical protein ETSY2_47210 [Candidatus Entotheonella gemina]
MSMIHLIEGCSETVIACLISMQVYDAMGSKTVTSQATFRDQTGHLW